MGKRSPGTFRATGNNPNGLALWRHRYSVYYGRVWRQFKTNLAFAAPVLSGLFGLGLLSSLLLAAVESQADKPLIKDGWAALYVTWIAMTTVGLGDLYPTTPAGRIVIACDALLGLVAFGVVVWLVTTTLDQGP